MKQVRRVMRSGSARSASLLGVGTILGQLVALAALPLLSRVYDPSTYGEYQSVYAVVGTLGAVVSFRLERAIPIARTQVEAVAVAFAAFLLAGVTIIALALSLLLLMGGGVMPFPAVDSWVIVLAIVAASMFTSSYVIATQWAIRQDVHRGIAIRNAAQPSVTAVSQVLFGLIASTLASLNLGLLLGRSIGALTAGADLARSGIRPAASDIVAAIRRYRQFVTTSAPSGWLNTLAINLPVILLASFYTAASAGYFGISNMAAMAPITAIGAAIGQVMVSDVAGRIRSRQGEISSVVRRTIGVATLAGTLGAVALVLISFLLGTLLGPQWEQAQPYLIALALLLVVRLPAVATGQVLSALEVHRWQLYIDGGRVALVVGILWGGSVAGWSPTDAVSVLSFCLGLTYVAAIMATLVFSRRHDQSLENGPA